jgi:internalin A
VRLRLRRRFSVLTLMLLVAVVAAALAWAIKPFLTERWAAAELAGRGYALSLEPSWLSQLTGQAVFDRVVEADAANLDRVSGDGRAGYLDPLTVEDAVCLESLPHLEGLSIAGLDDRLLPRLSGLSRLRRLTLFDARCTEQGLIRLLPHLTGLRSLSIRPGETMQQMNEPLIGDAGLAALAKLPRFRNLEGRRLCNVSDEGLAALGGIVEIEALDLALFPQKRISDAGLAHLSRLPNLSALSLGRVPVTDAGLAHLSRLSKLSVLVLNSMPITDAGLAKLKRLPLEHLDLRDTRIGDAGVAHLRAMNRLEHLNLQGTRVTDAGLAELSGVKSLTWLRLIGTKVTDAGLVHLYGLPRLKVLDLRGTRVTDEGVKALQKACPRLQVDP